MECQGIGRRNPKGKTHRGAETRPVDVKHVLRVKSAKLMFALNALNGFTRVRNWQRLHMRTLSKLTVLHFLCFF